MTVSEYRKKYPHCRYCVHCKLDVSFPTVYPCRAKRKDFMFNRAKRCPLYEPE